MKAKHGIDSFEKFLLESIRNKKVKTVFSKPADFTPEQKKRIDNTIAKAMDMRLLRQKTATVNKNKTLPAFILSAREKASLSVKRISELLKTDEELYDRIEKGALKISALPVETIAGIMTAFNIKLKELTGMLEKEAMLPDKIPAGVWATARSSHKAGKSDRAKNIKHGIEGLMLEINKQKKDDNADMDKYNALIGRVKKYLTEKDETDLL